VDILAAILVQSSSASLLISGHGLLPHDMPPCSKVGAGFPFALNEDGLDRSSFVYSDPLSDGSAVDVPLPPFPMYLEGLPFELMVI